MFGHRPVLLQLYETRRFTASRRPGCFEHFENPKLNVLEPKSTRNSPESNPGSVNRTNREAERQPNLKGATSLPVNSDF